MAASTFQCPNCKEYVNADSTVCRFCKSPIDAATAQLAAEQQQSINTACNSASMVRNFAAAMWVGFFVRLIPFVSWPGTIIMWLGLLVVPIWSLIWWIKYGRIGSDDRDLKRAKRNLTVSIGLWILLIAAIVALTIFVRFLLLL